MTKPPRYFKRVQAATPEDIMVALADFAAQVPAGQEIVEIGVFMGRTALQLAWGARQGNRAHVTAIDAWDLPGNTYAPPFTYPATRRWAHHHVKTLGFSRDITLVQAFSTDAAMAYEGPPVGLLFVDGDHSEEGARRDIETWAPHLAPDARIAVDDYGHPDWPGVKTAVDKLVEEGFLDPIEIYHERLAVTRISVVGEVDRELNKLSATAITSEGVHPSPEPRSDICQKCGSGLLPDGEHVRTDLAPCHPPTSDEVLALFVQEGEADLATVHEESYRRQFVREGEAEGDTVGVSIDSLNIAQLKALAKRRGITLGARKDKRSEILQALRDGK